MTIISDGYEFTFKRKPARMHVIRNDGFCWGRLVTADDEFDVSTRRDFYDYDDETAAEAFIRVAKTGRYEEPYASWRVGW